jgi:signal transduction histidine kinase
MQVGKMGLISFISAGLLWSSAVLRAEIALEDGPLDRMVSFFSGDLKKIDEELDQLKPLLSSQPIPPQQTGRLGYSSTQSSSVNARFVQIDLGRPVNIDAVILVPMQVSSSGWPGPGYGFPIRYRVEVSLNPDFSNSDVIAQDDGADYPNPGSNPVVLAEPHTIGRYVRFTATKMWARKDKGGLAMGNKVLALGELMVMSGNLNLAAGLPSSAITTSDSAEDSGFGKVFLVDGQSVLGPPVSGEPGPPGILTKSSDKKESQAWVQVDLEQELEVQEIRLFPAWTADAPERRGYGFPTKFRVEISNDPNLANPILIGEYNNPNSPNENPVTIRGTGAAGRYVRLTATSLSPVSKGFALAIGEMEVYAEGENFAYGKPVLASSSVEEKGWGKAFLVDGATSHGKVMAWSKWFEQLDRKKEAYLRQNQLIQDRERKVKALVETVIRTAGYVVGGLLILFVYLSFRSLLKKRRALEDLRTRIARDIHDEIGSGLGTISLLSRMAQDGDWEDGREDLREINRISVSMSEAMRDIVWFNRTDVDTVRDLLMRMRETAESMVGKQNQFNFNVVGEELVRPIGMEIRREIFLIFKEALHNILKHANAKRVDVRAGVEGSDFVLHIRDDGKGFDQSRETSGAGMGSMKQRAESLRGSLQLTSSPGGGTSLALRTRLK